jgi:hypothetical protein
MHLYLTQLLEDLAQAAANPPVAAYIEPPPHLEANPVIAELALVPFKPISEWTGIDREAFPPGWKLTPAQMKKVNNAIFRVFEALQIELIDAPDNLPPEFLYDVLTDAWDQPVQYLPSSGMDLELCTGDPFTCPYGEYCDCGNLENPDMDEPKASDLLVNDDDYDIPF